MPKLSLNKSALHKERTQLALYKKVLPSLDLKRRQLMREMNAAKQAFEAAKAEIDRYVAQTAHKYPMLANRKIEHEDLVRIADIEFSERNIVGVRIPTLQAIRFEEAAYPVLGKPVWTEMAIGRIKEALRMEIEKEMLHHRITLIERALVKVTQRVNLFEKVLIPTAQNNIKRLAILLDDMQRSSVVRSKLAKSKMLKG